MVNNSDTESTSAQGRP